MQIQRNNKPDGTIELTITIPWPDVKKSYDEIVNEAIKTVAVKGFRKGKAPRKLAEEKLDEEKVWQQTLETIVPQYYSQALQKENIKPVITPNIQLLKAAPENDLVLKAETAEAPQFELGDYKKALAEIKKPTDKIWTPGKDEKVKTVGAQRAAPEAEKRASLDNVLKKLLDHVKLTLPSVLIDRQTNTQLTQLIDQIKQVGMNIQQYAQSKGTTPEQIREQVRKEAENTLKLEFILEKIAETEKITVSDKDIDDFISKAKDEKEKKMFAGQRYQIASLLRRQKTLQKLLD